MVLTSTKTTPDLDAPDAISPGPSRSSSVPDDLHRAAQRMRPSVTPAYYQGRPAWFWLARFRRGSLHA
jgi:hypothetical protein